MSIFSYSLAGSFFNAAGLKIVSTPFCLAVFAAVITVSMGISLDRRQKRQLWNRLSLLRMLSGVSLSFAPGRIVMVLSPLSSRYI